MAYILAADIGGTNSRFGLFGHFPGQDPELLESFDVLTDSVSSLEQLLGRIREEGLGLDPMDADQVVLAVAGPVRDGKSCSLTNASWDIDLRESTGGLPFERTVLINDFVAQALGCRTRDAAGSSISIQKECPGPEWWRRWARGRGSAFAPWLPWPPAVLIFWPCPPRAGTLPGLCHRTRVRVSALSQGPNRSFPRIWRHSGLRPGPCRHAPVSDGARPVPGKGGPGDRARKRNDCLVRTVLRSRVQGLCSQCAGLGRP